MFIGIILMVLTTACTKTFTAHHMMKRYSECLYDTNIISNSKIIISNIPSNIRKQAEKISHKAATKNSYELLPRVTRWSTDDIKDIRTFLDNGTPTYAHLTNEQVWIQHAFHYLPGVVDLLNGPYHDKYFIKTPQGRCAHASLVLLPKKKNKTKEVSRDGTIEIGIDTNNLTPTIYHMMFRPKDNTPSLKIPYMVFLKKQSQPSQEDEKSYKKVFKAKKIITYFNKEEKVYTITYPPPAQSSYRSITLYIHMIDTNSPIKASMGNECCSIFAPYKRLLQYAKLIKK